MNRRLAPVLLLVLLAAIAAGLVMIYRLRLARGDVFPEYSTLRADPLGTRAFQESLALLPGVESRRSLQPLAKLARTPERTLIFAGMQPEDWSQLPAGDFRQLDQAVRAGSRAVILLRTQTGVTERPGDKKKPAREKEKKEAKKDGDAVKKEAPAPEPVLRWEVVLKRRSKYATEDFAGSTREAPSAFAGALTWKSDVYFEVPAGSPWRVLYRRNGQPVLMERTLGKGSVVMASDSFFVSNEALQRERATGLLAWLPGAHREIVFEEHHLGLEEETGVAALARRYGLTGAFFTLLGLVGLFVWRRLAWFIPPSRSADERAPGHEPTAGLEALLHRAVRPSALLAACRTEWRKTSRPADEARLETAWSVEKQTPVQAYNAAVKALKKN